MSAPRAREVLIPVTKAFASPQLWGISATFFTPCSFATSTVLSVEPSFIIKISISSIPSILFGKSASVTGKDFSSL